ncbi:autotransporter outer membrane beta-barrel domain-containing protein [Bradyrhizobium cenepequi]|uniref:autotransporter outer membrane beta-barrel domain-containing protein n=1 Tax=Bradyrhizobium cenepequi TaxID=2821403 RepID=UPI001CE27E5E|nr:autotransporter outer membrane beta-barrel domain-containing protein [Bradyrhizobium cenepequi]
MTPRPLPPLPAPPPFGPPPPPTSPPPPPPPPATDPPAPPSPPSPPPAPPSPPPPGPPGSPPPPLLPPPPPTPLIRSEIPGYVLVPAMAQQMGVLSVGTFHKRVGDQALLNNFGEVNGAWMRGLGETREQQWSSTIAGINYQLAPKIDGHAWGIQTGLDLFASDNPAGQDRFGLFYTHAEASGTVYGNTLAINGNRSGSLALQGDSIGGYWTHVAPNGWYVDAVTMHTWLSGGASSDRRFGAGAYGTAMIASLESGVPFSIAPNWSLEPQGQVIWQRVSFNDTSDAFSTIDYQSFDAVIGRLGLRLENTTLVYGTPWQSFVSVDVWHNFSRTANVIFNDRNVATALGGTSLEVRGGLSMQLTATVAAYGSVGYTTNLNDETLRSVGGNVGVRVRW